MATAALIVAAGRGTRAGGSVPKQYADLGGRPVLAHTAAAFARHGAVDQVQIVIHADDEDACRQACSGLDVRPPVAGGETRQRSVLAGLRALEPGSPERVLIHDAARPFVEADLIDRVIAALDAHTGAIPALPVADTVKRADGRSILETVDRTGLWTAQTPQGFRFDAILSAHLKAQAAGRDDLTDDAAVAEWCGHDVVVVDGAPENRKLTTAGDIAEAQRRMLVGQAAGLLDIRVGHGFDVHAFEPGDHVILCGVEVPHSASLKGHSDADVGLHALTDAIFGALGDGDIGQHFPPSDPQWRGAASDIFLKAAAETVSDRAGIIANVDVTLVCEAPKIGPHAPAMRAAIADILSLDIGRVSVKATTSERLGFTGRGEGIAAHATATVRLPL
ncbi:MAG: bifunctional 2-C-methyl-D-erythritol 4-phosphate cytidylyltransferase/2-C-methyl-D-erythritol 2,4-cyclodiphosphate synthase [Hyphomicrobiales bacterium]